MIDKLSYTVQTASGSTLTFCPLTWREEFLCCSKRHWQSSSPSTARVKINNNTQKRENMLCGYFGFVQRKTLLKKGSECAWPEDRSLSALAGPFGRRTAVQGCSRDDLRPGATDVTWRGSRPEEQGAEQEERAPRMLPCY